LRFHQSKGWALKQRGRKREISGVPLPSGDDGVDHEGIQRVEKGTQERGVLIAEEAKKMEERWGTYKVERSKSMKGGRLDPRVKTVKNNQGVRAWLKNK